MMWIDPSGFRWLNETWLKVDRGVSFYNNEAIPPDRGFLISRLSSSPWVSCRGAEPASFRRDAPRRNLTPHGSTAPPCSEPRILTVVKPQPVSLASLGMTTTRPGLLAGAWQVARVELTELRSSPGLYLFIPLILLQTIGTSLVAVGFLDTPLLITSGTFAVRTMGTLADVPLLASPVLHGRVARAGTIDPAGRDRLCHSDPHGLALPGQRHGHDRGGDWRSSLAVALAGVIALLIQGRSAWSCGRSCWSGACLLMPTVLVWTALVMAVHTITQNRYTTYALGLAVLCFTGYRAADQSDQLGRQLAAVERGAAGATSACSSSTARR